MNGNMRSIWLKALTKNKTIIKAVLRHPFGTGVSDGNECELFMVLY
jgi:hypothetical protein